MPSVEVIKLGVVLDPIEKINVKKDSTIAMVEAAQAKGWQVYVMQQQDLSIQNGKAYASMQSLIVDVNKQPWYQLSEKEERPLSELKSILMRKDPPFNMDYIHSTYVLDHAEREGVLVVNKPQALRDANEKVFTSFFPECIPATLFSMDMAKLKAFVKQQKHVVLKPLDGMGGRSIFSVKESDANLNVILETLTKNNSEMITAQKYIPEITQGDKRILLIDGEPIPYGLARMPSKEDFRGNLAAGGKGEVFKLSERDHWLCEQVAPIFKAMGLFFVGLDVIGDYITEINVTSPTCIREIEAGADVNIAERFMEKLQKLLV